MALPQTDEAKRLAWYTLKKFVDAQEAERRRLLGLWVSELEPEFIYSRMGTFALVGITVAGWDKVLIYSESYSELKMLSEQEVRDRLFGCFPLTPSRRSAHIVWIDETTSLSDRQFDALKNRPTTINVERRWT